MALYFSPSKAELILVSREGVDVDRITLGGPYPSGMTALQPLPPGFEWRDQESMDFSTYGGYSRWGTTTYLDEVIKGSEQHPEDSYGFQNVGRLNPTEADAQDGKAFLTTCTPDPAKKSRQ